MTKDQPSFEAVPTFDYSEADFLRTTDGKLSVFDQLLTTTWTKAQLKGCFRYQFDKNSLPTRTIPGRHRFKCYLNEGRAFLRRKPQVVQSLTMDFDAQGFNFCKIKPDEVLFKVANKHTDDRATVIINSSPVEFGNSLLVPKLESCRPQIFTDDSLRLAIDMVALSGTGTLRAGFNSLGAMASVNHQHWHIYYFDDPLLIESLPIVDNLLVDWPIQAVVFEITTITTEEIRNVVDKVSKIVGFCLEAQIGHNLFVTRCQGKAIRVFLWPRNLDFSLKSDPSRLDKKMEITPAFCEFTGFFTCKTRQFFDDVDEEFLVKIIESSGSRIDDVKQFLSLIR